MRPRLLYAATAALLLTGALIATAPEPAPAAPTAAKDDGLALTPPMGFNNWNAFGCGVTEKLIVETADFFVSSGMKDAGYEYVNIDDCWSLKERVDGKLVADPAKFPRGMAWLADYVHGKGLKLGIYNDAGTHTCAGYPGSLGYEKVDAQTFADWGIDYLKYDNCNNQGLPAEDRYRAMSEALQATGRPIVFSICEWGANQPWEWGPELGHLWRTTGDITDDWDSVRNIIRANAPLARHAGPGQWNDPDMLEVGNGGMTQREYRTHFSMWAIMAAPLLVGSDLRQATPETMEILLNREVIAVDQDPLGIQGTVVRDDGGLMVFAKPLQNGDVAVALYNENDYGRRIATTAAEVGLAESDGYRLRDLWQHADTHTTDEIASFVPAHGAVLYRVRPTRMPDSTPPATSFALDTPLPYPGAPASPVKAGPNEVTTALRNHGTRSLRDASVELRAPAGWQVSASSPPSARWVRPGEALATRWTVTVPAGTPGGDYALRGVVRYTRDRVSEFETFTTSVTVATPVPAGTPYASDVPWVRAGNGWGPVERDLSNGEYDGGDGQPITLNGTVYAKGLGTHAPSEVVYFTAGDCTRFTADVGVDDEVANVAAQRGTVRFQVWRDNTKVTETDVLTWQDAAYQLSVDVSGAQFVRLIVTTAGDGNGHDHADWADARFHCG